MSAAERRPLQYPAGVQLPFTGEDSLRRLARQCMVGPQSRVLVLGVGQGQVAAYLARECGPELVLADSSDAPLASARAALEKANLNHRAHYQKVEPDRLPWGEQEFSSIWVDAQTLVDLEASLVRLRPHLVLKGRLCLQWPVRVGRGQHPSPLVRAWEAALGEPLMLPRDCLQILSRNGFEPQIVECLEDAELADFYRQVEAGLSSSPRAKALAEEVALFRAQNGRSAASFAVMVGRRKEPGEKPPPSRAE
jgi:SAM-dependent methyltransferase